MEKDWEYYKKTNFRGDIREIYRVDADIRGDVAKLDAMQRLMPNFEWVWDADDKSLSNQWAKSEFDFGENRLSKADVDALIADWKQRGHWPGRR